MARLGAQKTFCEPARVMSAVGSRGGPTLLPTWVFPWRGGSLLFSSCGKGSSKYPPPTELLFHQTWAGPTKGGLGGDSEALRPGRSGNSREVGSQPAVLARNVGRGQISYFCATRGPKGASAGPMPLRPGAKGGSCNRELRR